MHAACAADWTFLTDIRAVVSLLEEYRSPCLKLAYDTYHFPFGARQRHVLEWLVPHIVVVHVADRRLPPSVDQQRCRLGDGRLPLAEIVATLQESGYAGAFDVKLIGPEIQANEYWQVLEQSQAAFAELAQSPARSSLA
jgi:sugar phosphate isomerase/epimerase